MIGLTEGRCLAMEVERSRTAGTLAKKILLVKLRDEVYMLVDKFKFREMDSNDQEFLEDMLYQAIYIPQGEKILPRDVVNEPKFKKYYEQYGNSNDLGYVALERNTGKLVGAIWLRLFDDSNKGWGFIESTIPELSMAVDYEFRGIGIGKYLLTHLLEFSQSKYPRISLSVDIDNYAKLLYLKLGFVEVNIEGNSVTMLLDRSR